jgi:4-hydroxyphenylpyruvate dioxygenase
MLSSNPSATRPILLHRCDTDHPRNRSRHSAAGGPSWHLFAPLRQKSDQDFLPLKGIDHVEFYVGNARQAAYYYRTAFGMNLVAYAGPETGQRDRVSYVVQQGKIRFVLTTSFRPDSSIAEHVAKHGDGAHVIALEVEDARQAWLETTTRGARSVGRALKRLPMNSAASVTSSIAAYGDTIHTFVERGHYNGPFLPWLPSRACGHCCAPHWSQACGPHGGERGLARHG